MKPFLHLLQILYTMATQPFDKNAKLRTPTTLAATYIVKGALAKHMNGFVTIGSKFESKVKGVFFHLVHSYSSF